MLVQTTLWGNLILGPTARDMHEASARDMSSKEIQEYILSKCKNLVPSFAANETIHAFAGARAKSTQGDWIIEFSKRHEINPIEEPEVTTDLRQLFLPRLGKCSYKTSSLIPFEMETQLREFEVRNEADAMDRGVPDKGFVFLDSIGNVSIVVCR